MGRCPTNPCSATSTRPSPTASPATASRGSSPPDAEQVEYPSAIRPTGSRRPLADMLAASEQGAGLLSAQSYDVVSYLEQGDTAAVQLTWRGTLAVPMGTVPAGSELVAHVGAFYAFAPDGRIARQSSYDCYEPFPA